MDLSILLLILIGAVPKILKKQILNSLTVSEYFILFSICMSFMTLGFFLYKTYVKKEKIQLKKAFNSSILPIFAILMVLKFTSIYYKLGIFKKMDVSKYIPIFKSLSIVATIILSVLFLNEKRKPKDIFGIALIVIGVYILNNIDLGVSTNA